MELLDLAPRQRWSSLAARARTHPHEVRTCDPSGLTPLHWSCFNRPPLSAVRALLDNDNAASESNDGNTDDKDGNHVSFPLVALTDVHGTTSLHAACSSHASPPIVAALVESYPPAALMQDEMGWTPLHFLCGTAFASSTFSEVEGRESVESVRILIRADAQSVDVVDGEGQTALDLLCEVMGAHHDPGWQFGRRRRRRETDVESSTAAMATTSLNGGGRSESAAEECFWSLAKELVAAMYCNLKGKDIGSFALPQVLHQCLELFVPGDLIRYILARYPEQANEVSKINDLDQLPLHIAAITNTHDGIIINDILIANPGAIQVRDSQGKLPLEYAIESKRTWNNGIRTLLNAYPEALQARRLNCALYPFILGKTYETRGKQAATVFRILRAKPDLVRVEIANDVP